MLTDEQLLQSPRVRAVLAKMAGQGLHKTAGAIALGVDEVTLENAVLSLCTKIAAQALKEQRIASALDSLEKVALSDGQKAVLGVGALGAGIGAAGGLRGAARANPEGDMVDYVGPSVAGGLAGAAALPVGALAGGALGLTAGRALEGASRLLPERFHLHGAGPVAGLAGAFQGAATLPRYVGEQIGEKTAANPFAAAMTRIRGASKTLPHPTPSAAPVAEGADAIVKGMGGRMGFAGKVTGGAAAPVPAQVKVNLPEYIQSYTPKHTPHNPNKAMDAAAGTASSRAVKKRPTQELGMNEADLKAHAFLNNPKSIHNQVAAARSAPAPAHDPFAALAAQGKPITAEGLSAAQPMNFGSGPVGNTAAPMFNLKDILARGNRPS